MKPALLRLAAGTYVEQVIIVGKDLTLSEAGQGATVIESPAELKVLYSTSFDHYPAVGIMDADVALANLTVDGAGQGNDNVRFTGAEYHNAGGPVRDLTCDLTAFDGTVEQLGDATVVGNVYTWFLPAASGMGDGPDGIAGGLEANPDPLFGGALDWAIAARGVCDGGPTIGNSNRGVPNPQADGFEVQFEDLMIFVLNYGTVSPALQLLPGAALDLAWERVDATTWALTLLEPARGLKGINLAGPLPDDVSCQVAAGVLLRVVTSEPVDHLEVTVLARDILNQNLPVDLQRGRTPGAPPGQRSDPCRPPPGDLARAR